MRSLIACVIVSVILWFNRSTSLFSIDREVAKYAFGRVFGSCLGFMLEIFSLDYISASKSVLIINNPLVTSILSYVILREKSGKHDLICFFLCTFGVVLLTNPFSSDTRLSGTNQLLGMILASLASLSFNLSYMALRKIKTKPVNSWILVFYIMLVNLFTMPTPFLFSAETSHHMTAYTDLVWLLLFLIGALTVSTLFFTHQMFYYETAARGSAYHNFQLLYTYLFDVWVMRSHFCVTELLGATCIIVGNLYIYIMKTLGYIS